MSHPAFILHLPSIAFWPVRISRPAEVEGRVGLGGWLHTEVVRLPEDGHPLQY